jgi:hypothetical protein
LDASISEYDSAMLQNLALRRVVTPFNFSIDRLRNTNANIVSCEKVAAIRLEPFVPAEKLIAGDVVALLDVVTGISRYHLVIFVAIRDNTGLLRLGAMGCWRGCCRGCPCRRRAGNGDTIVVAGVEL